MFDKERFNFALENYKKDFSTWWQEEKYKWEAVKCFQDNWNLKADKFYKMFHRSIAKISQTRHFLSWFWITYVERLIIMYPEEARVIFNNFFKIDEKRVESLDLYLKIYQQLIDFKMDFNMFEFKHNVPNEDSTIKNDSLITTFLWLKYPDKCYIYDVNFIKDVAVALRNYDDIPENALVNDVSFVNYYKFCDEICNEIRNDTELLEIVKNHLDENCYSDSESKILTLDVCYYIWKYHDKILTYWQEKIFDESKLIKKSFFEPYGAENFLSEVFISEEKYNRLVSILNYKKNIILQGAPGVGKTFAAKKLAYSIIGTKDDSKIEFVQFHQNYSYEDFVIGWRPTATNFELQTGIFYNFCKKAETEPDKDFFFIIDEINRGNLSKIFGELLMLIESDKRGKEKVKIPANGENFSVPENLYIIGMMNTADRSLALIDYALRRRFSFIEFEPAFDSEGFKTYQSDLQNKTFDNLITQIKKLNAEISADKTLGKGFCIGHSYFCNFDGDEENLKTVVECEILPTLEEYFFDSEEKFQDWSEKLRGVFK